MNILLIGHRGYLGRGLYTYLSRKHRVIGWDQQEDVFSLDAAVLAKHDIELVINLSLAADRASANLAIDSPSDLVNVGGARHLAKVLKGSEITWVQMSTREVLSANVYGVDDLIETPTGYRPKFLVGEDQLYAPRNSYGKSKLISELISESHPRSVVVRLTTGYTDFDRPGEGSWMMHLIRTVLQKKPVTLTRGGLQFRDPLHMDDLGRLLELLHEKQVFHEKIHAGGGEPNLISLLEFVRMVDPSVTVDTAPGGDYGYAFDNAKAERLTGWRPEVLVRERLPVLIDNVKHQRVQEIAETGATSSPAAV
ncbi:MAG: NAD(P)-dependent oxidoreductase [Chloroflexi bacterium]|nr:NAD(P)-dependent oxidoreductase [Chloroflexota bacterium]